MVADIRSLFGREQIGGGGPEGGDYLNRISGNDIRDVDHRIDSSQCGIQADAGGKVDTGTTTDSDYVVPHRSQSGGSQTSDIPGCPGNSDSHEGVIFLIDESDNSG
ncbi:hypothetical protein GCM10027167_71800 [Nocardia heshunensis]